MSHPSLQSQNSIDQICNLIAGITPFDAIEQSHIKETLVWIKSGTPIFRIQKPATPNKHFVSSAVIFDEKSMKILLVNHKNYMRWLPAGGHLEIDEHPKMATARECMEELNLKADFWCEDPIFLTSTFTDGPLTHHWDVSLWYVIKGDSHEMYDYDPCEFHGIRWFSFDEIPYDSSDPHMRRFVAKFKQML